VTVPLALAFPEHVRGLYSAAIVVALLITLGTWSRWRSDLA
jgi:hypothetical protein